MPEYFFKCRQCGREKIIERKMTDPDPTVHCEACGEIMFRSYLPLNAHYRGDGFYTTDKVLSDPEPD